MSNIRFWLLGVKKHYGWIRKAPGKPELKIED
ncbi:hypothetical protein D1AOALGA4SA_8218 [Olavius algarvensis Delta 1 endosymbiont]|nr:hypothetical protein D1AOALGA4SA_8218 [Olavius algarvensis Delta 1 endosymbiont]